MTQCHVCFRYYEDSEWGWLCHEQVFGCEEGSGEG